MGGYQYLEIESKCWQLSRHRRQAGWDWGISLAGFNFLKCWKGEGRVVERYRLPGYHWPQGTKSGLCRTRQIFAPCQPWDHCLSRSLYFRCNYRLRGDDWVTRGT
jgi:hypothetical protein